MLQHIVKTQNFNREFLSKVFSSARDMRKVVHSGGTNALSGKVIATIFYEPSTRTRLSFEAAAMRLGARVLSTESARQFSSTSKGEILEDTIRMLDKYCDCIVLRYHEDGGAQRAAHVSQVPVINAGDGKGQHPTQSLLDLFTIEDEVGSIDGISVVLAGDLKHGRTVHSLAYLLGKFEDITLYLASPPGLEMPKNITDYLTRHKVDFHQFDSLAYVMKEVPVQVVYHTRTQKERFEAPAMGDKTTLLNYEDFIENFTITRNLANSLDPDAIILHPLPRVDEIRYGVDDNHRAKYFKQAENGLYVRMALLNLLLG